MNDSSELVRIEASRPPVPLSAFSSIEAFEGAQRMAKLLMASDMVPTNYRQNIGSTIIAMEMAQRTNASILAVMQNLVVIHGKPGWESKFLIGSVNTCGKFSPLRYDMTGESGTDSWGCRAWAVDLRDQSKLVGAEVTVAMSKAEGWYQKNGSKWKTMPELMLRYRAASFWVKQYAPEISLGMQTAEELHDVYEARPGADGAYSVDRSAEVAQDLNELVNGGEDADDGPSTPHWPKKRGDDWVDSAGEVYDEARHGWSRAGHPSVTADGTFRARKGTAKQASPPQPAPEQASAGAGTTHTVAPHNDRAKAAAGEIGSQEILEMIRKAETLERLDEIDDLIRELPPGTERTMCDNSSASKRRVIEAGMS